MPISCLKIGYFSCLFLPLNSDIDNGIVQLTVLLHDTQMFQVSGMRNVAALSVNINQWKYIALRDIEITKITKLHLRVHMCTGLINDRFI